GEEVEVGEPAVEGAFEPEDVVGQAHPVLAALAETALAAGDDLLGDDAVAELDAVLLRGALAEGDDVTGVLVTGDAGALDVAALAVGALEKGTAEPALHVRGADPGRLDFDQELTGAGFRYRDILDAVVARGVADDGLHGIRHEVPSLLRTGSARRRVG
ncbi:MAG TPA: hypothetical protein VKB09_10080, partial [Thermomicrobiales bacterium]|nr:hypothetical protein [Thermomicrobiales bacterium]